LAGKREVKGPPGRPGCMWENNIKLILQNRVGRPRTGFIWRGI